MSLPVPGEMTVMMCSVPEQSLAAALTSHALTVSVSVFSTAEERGRGNTDRIGCNRQRERKVEESGTSRAVERPGGWSGSEGKRKDS